MRYRLLAPYAGYGMTSTELTQLAKVVLENKETIERVWHEFFG